MRPPFQHPGLKESMSRHLAITRFFRSPKGHLPDPASLLPLGKRRGRFWQCRYAADHVIGNYCILVFKLTTHSTLQKNAYIQDSELPDCLCVPCHVQECPTIRAHPKNRVHPTDLRIPHIQDICNAERLPIGLQFEMVVVSPQFGFVGFFFNRLDFYFDLEIVIIC